MRGLKQDRSARVVIAGHALMQNVRRGHYELAVEEPTNRRLAVAFDELIWRSGSREEQHFSLPWAGATQQCLLKGKMTARYADRDEVYEAGDAFYFAARSRPGAARARHRVRVVQPRADELRAAEAVMVKNMQAMQDGATP